MTTQQDRHRELVEAVHDLLDMLSEIHTTIRLDSIGQKDSDRVNELKGRLARLTQWNGDGGGA